MAMHYDEKNYKSNLIKVGIEKMKDVISKRIKELEEEDKIKMLRRK
jgi:hypothetical protein